MNTQAIETLQALLNTLQGQVTGLQGQVDALTAAIALLKNGYQSDQDSIAAQVSEQVSAVLSPIQASIVQALPTMIATPAMKI